MTENLTEREAGQYTPLTLAILGDSVYEVMTREKIIREAERPVSKLNELKVEKVCATYQAEVAYRIADMLTEKELAVLKRGRNATGTNVPKSADARTYRMATGLECLFGFLYLTGNSRRLEEIFEAVWNLPEDKENNQNQME